MRGVGNGYFQRLFYSVNVKLFHVSYLDKVFCDLDSV